MYPAHVASDIGFSIRYLDAATVGLGALAGNFYGPNEWVDAEDHAVSHIRERRPRQVLYSKQGRYAAILRQISVSLAASHSADMHRATRVIVRIVSAWADQATTVHPWPRVGI